MSVSFKTYHMQINYITLDKGNQLTNTKTVFVLSAVEHLSVTIYKQYVYILPRMILNNSAQLPQI